MRSTLGRLAVLALACAGRPAAADNATDAKRLFDEGRALYEKEKYLEACTLFAKSFELDPAVGTKLNLAECAEREGKPRKAWLLWLEAAEEFERTPDKAARAKYARERADQLAPKLATIVVRVARPAKQLAIRVGDRDVTVAGEIVERVEPGQVAITATAPGREPFATRVAAQLGKQVEVEVPALARVGGAVEPEPEAEPERSTGWKPAAIVLGGVTVASAGVYLFSYLRLRSLDFGTKCIALPGGGFTSDSPTDCVNGETYTRVSLVSGIIGIGAGLATGWAIYKLRTAHRRKDVAVIPVVTPELAGATAVVRW